MKRNILKKYTAFLCSAIMMGSIISYVPSYAESANLVSNTSGWDAHCQDGGAGSISYDSGRLALKISSTGDVAWSIQLYYDLIPQSPHRRLFRGHTRGKILYRLRKFG